MAELFTISQITETEAPDLAPMAAALVSDNFTNDPQFGHYSAEQIAMYLTVNTEERLVKAFRDPQTISFASRCATELSGISMVRYDPGTDRWKLRRLHVGRSFRGLGIATAFTDKICETVTERGAVTIYADAPPEAADFFLSQGWSGYTQEKLLSYKAGNEKGQVVVPRFVLQKTLE
jgi:GNAT superfamily N-acetyltransferase